MIFISIGSAILFVSLGASSEDLEQGPLAEFEVAGIVPTLDPEELPEWYLLSAIVNEEKQDTLADETIDANEETEYRLGQEYFDATEEKKDGVVRETFVGSDGEEKDEPEEPWFYYVEPPVEKKKVRFAGEPYKVSAHDIIMESRKTPIVRRRHMHVPQQVFSSFCDIMTCRGYQQIDAGYLAVLLFLLAGLAILVVQFL